MKKLGKLNLRNTAVLQESEMKMVLGGSGGVIENACRVGTKCTVVYGSGTGNSVAGTCQGSTTGGASGVVSCYCDAHGSGSGSGNSDGLSNCFKK